METVSTFIIGTELTMAAAARQQTIQTQNGGASARVCVVSACGRVSTQHREGSRELA